MLTVKQIAVSANEIYQLAFLIEVFLNHSLKGSMTNSFCRSPCSLPSISKKSTKVKCLSKLLLPQIRHCQIICFKPLNEMINGWLNW